VYMYVAFFYVLKTLTCGTWDTGQNCKGGNISKNHFKTQVVNNFALEFIDKATLRGYSQCKAYIDMLLLSESEY